ncbi:transcription factor [Colletotrichum sojae]|uniref:Transcription factor n=1 Tax=Colletotrichum sojae TaxID=2175907 RepID=A0A8H6JSZ9_9PEZI|nr:transcription factor [Colletotrichum sojae]
MEKNNVKRISCKRCQQRKIRCSRTFPCGNCSTASARCEYRESDFKRPPVSREYVASLETRIASLEGFLARLKDAGGDERNQILDGAEVKDYVPSFSETPLLEEESAISEALAKASLQETTDGLMIYHGPTSFFQGDVGDARAASSSSTSKPSPSQADRANLSNPTMRLCVGLFFTWLYPLFMFIDREAFLGDFEENPVDGDFCSPPLVYATAALGALMSGDPEVRALSATFAATAQNILLTEGMDAPKPTSIQALLCCGFYDVGQRKISRGWLLAGMAFRMGQDIGFQRDPTYLESEMGERSRAKSASPSPYPFDTEFRRRVYWGCFLSDKIFSLYLGRPATMHETDGDMNISEPLPNEPPIWDNWLSAHDLSSLKTMRPDGDGPGLTPVFNQEIELARIIHDMLSTTFAPKKQKDAKARRWTEISLNKLNARLVAWHEALPADMRWKKWWTNKDVLQPNVAILHVLYHSTRICLNLPFLASVGPNPSISDETSNNPLAVSYRICKTAAESLSDVIQRFRGQHTLGNAPILFVGGSVIAMNAIMVTLRHQGGGSGPAPSVKDTLLPFLYEALGELAPSWSLAGEARLRFRSALNKQQHADGAAEDWQDGAPAPVPETPGDPSVAGPSSVDMTPRHGASFGNLSPEQYVWEPMNVLGGDAAYWGAMGDSLLGTDLNFFDGMTDFDWPDEPPTQ